MKYRFALLLVLLAAALVRIPSLDKYPPPLNQDEATRGYDAWSLLRTGADQHGARWPFFLKSFGPGDYTAALSAYLTIPFVAILGPTTWAIRLPDAILGILSVWLTYALLRPGLGVVPALVAAAVLATDPWHVALTRTGHEAGFATFFILLGLYLLCESGALPWIGGEVENESTIKFQRAGFAFAGVVSLCAAAWVYPATRLIVPCICMLMLVVFRKRLRAVWTERPLMLAIFAGVVIGTAPLYLTAIRNPTMLAARATIALMGNTPDRLSMLRDFCSNYASNISPRNLFWHSEDMSGAALPGLGQHLLITIPFLAVGFWRVLATCRSNPWSLLLMLWVMLYPVPAAICRDWNPHPMRSVAGISVFVTICGIGATWIFHRLEKSPRVLKAILTSLVGIWVLNSIYAGDRYARAIRKAQFEYQTPLLEAMKFVAAHKPTPDFVLVTNKANQPYIYALLAGPVLPETYHSSSVVRVPGSLGFDQIVRWNNYYFVPARPLDRSLAMQEFSECWEMVPSGKQGIVVQTGADSPRGQLLVTFQPPEDMDPAHRFEIRSWTKSP